MLPSSASATSLAGDDNIRPTADPQRRRLLDLRRPGEIRTVGFSSRHPERFRHIGSARHADDEMPGVFNPRRGQHRGVRRVAMDRVQPASRSVRTVSAFISITVGPFVFAQQARHRPSDRSVAYDHRAMRV